MFVQLIHKETGKTYLVEVRQVAVFNDGGQPIALTYEHDGLIVHSDASHDDWDTVVKTNSIKQIKTSKK